MSTNDTALAAIVDGAVDFYMSHELMAGRGQTWTEAEREGLRGFTLANLAYLATQAAVVGVEADLNATLLAISAGDGR